MAITSKKYYIGNTYSFKFLFFEELNLVINEILRQIVEHECGVVGYADDLVNIVRSPFLKSLMRIIQGIVQRIKI